MPKHERIARQDIYKRACEHVVQAERLQSAIYGADHPQVNCGWTAEAIRTAYAIAVKPPADMTAAELREQLEQREILVTCLRTEVKSLSQAGAGD